MLRFLSIHKLLTPALTTNRYYMSGGGHHEIDYYAVVTKNKKSCKAWPIAEYYLNPN